MSKSKQHLIAYHPDNQQVATEIREDLAKAGYFVEGKNLSENKVPLRQSVKSPSGAILLLVTDNFLKSDQSMNGAFEALQHWADNGQLVPIVADGRYLKADGTGWEGAPTSFERVSNIIHYMNYWQDKYLALRKEKRGNEDDAALDQQIEVTKGISGEIGEFLRSLRSLRWHSLADFKAGNYAAFRQFTDENPEDGAQTTRTEPHNATPETPVASSQSEQTLADIILASGKELMAENTDIGKPKKAPAPEQPPVDLNDIAGLERSTGNNPTTTGQSSGDDEEEEGVELSAILQDVLNDDDENGEDFKFVGEDPDHPEDFDLDSLFEDDDAVTEKAEADIDYGADEVSLELVSDEEEGLVLRADGHGHATPEEVLEHAVLLFDDGKQWEGLDFLEQTVLLNADDNTMRYYYAYALARYGQDVAGAKSQLEVILAKDVEHTDALFLVGELAESQGDFDEAKHSFETVAALQPDFPEVYYRLGMLTLQHFEGQENLALEFFKKSVEFNQRNADAHYILATLYNEQAGDTAHAIKHFNLALRYDPNHSYANYDLALLHFQNGNFERASEHYLHAIALNPELKSAENDAAFLPQPQDELEESPTTLPAPDLHEFVEEKEEEEEEETATEVEKPNNEITEDPSDSSPETAYEPTVENDASTMEMEEEEALAAFEELFEEPDTEGPASVSLETANANLEETEIAQSAEAIAQAVETSLDHLTALPDKNVELTLEDLLEADEEDAPSAPNSAPLVEAKTTSDPTNKNFTATLEEILDQEEDEAEREFVLPLSNKKDLNSLKTVLITGATSGIGRATAELFASNGYRVIATGRRTERLEEMALLFKERYNTQLLTLPFDVRDLGAVKSTLENLPEAWQQVDILINNAGLSRGLAPIHEGDVEHWETMIDTNIKGLLYLTRAIAPQMVKRRSGHIINVASSAGKEVYPGGNVYCATKFAVDALTKAMRLDLFAHNVRVSQVAPGHVEETEFASVRFDGDTERASKVYENFQPLKSSDVAEVIYFIATRPAHVNVQDVLVFGSQQAGSNFIDRSGR